MLHSKKGRRKAGGGVGDRLESPVETHSMFAVFFCMCCCCCFFTVRGGGGKLMIKSVSLNRILKGGATGGCFSGLGELHVSMDLIRIFQ